MTIRFHFDKTLQAAAYLLRRERSRQMNYMRLIKILYIAERESLKETGRPIIGGRIVALERGPVLESLLKLIRGEHLDSPKWSEFIHKENYHLEMVKDPGVGKLSRYVVEKLEEIAQRHENDDEWAMVRVTHSLPEWVKNDPGSSSKVIPLVDVFEAVGLKHQMEAILSDIRADQAASRFFAEKSLGASMAAN